MVVGLPPTPSASSLQRPMAPVAVGRDHEIDDDVRDAIAAHRLRVDAAIRPAARGLRERVAALREHAARLAPFLGDAELAVFRVEVRVVVALVGAGVDCERVLVAQLLDLDVVLRRELHRLPRRSP